MNCARGSVEPCVYMCALRPLHGSAEQTFQGAMNIVIDDAILAGNLAYVELRVHVQHVVYWWCHTGWQTWGYNTSITYGVTPFGSNGATVLTQSGEGGGSDTFADETVCRHIAVIIECTCMYMHMYVHAHLSMYLYMQFILASSVLHEVYIYICMYLTQNVSRWL